MQHIRYHAKAQHLPQSSLYNASLAINCLVRAIFGSQLRLQPSGFWSDVFDADFCDFTFVPHFHDTLILGLILDGSKHFRHGRTLNKVTVGGFSVVNPGDIHTGGVMAAGSRLRYTAVYPNAALLAEAGLPEGADYPAAVIDDPDLRPLFVKALASNTPVAEDEEPLLIALAGLTGRYCLGSPRLPAACPKAVRRAIEYAQSSLESTLRLEEIASAAEVSPRHLIRCF